VRGGKFWNTRSGEGTNGPIVIRDTVFEGTKFVMTSGTNATDCDYNAYLTGGEWFTNTAVSNLFVSGFNWQTGALGDCYLPTNSMLIDRGSVAATNVGLYHFTTQTNQTKEAASQVDIGYHFVAVEGSGIPPDHDGDGLADYFEDSNGNGLYDSGLEPGSWLSADSDNDDEIDQVFRVQITRPAQGGAL